MRYLVTNRPEWFKANLGWESFASVEESRKALEKYDTLGFDTETTSLSSFLGDFHCIQLSTPEDQYVVDLMLEENGGGTPVDILLYKKLLESKTLIGHNLLFDLSFLLKYEIKPLKIWDTFLAEYIMTAGLIATPRNLAATVERHLGVGELDKDIREIVIEMGINHIEALEYSFKDVQYLHALKEAQEVIIAKERLGKVHELENRFSPVMAYMEWCGIHLDYDEWFLLARHAEYEEWQALLTLEAHFKAEYPDLASDIEGRINWTSSKQVAAIFEFIGINVDDPKKPGSKTVNKKVIEKYKDDFEIIKLYIDYREKNKTVTTYGRSWESHILSDRRIHTKFRQLVATGRTACGETRGDNPFPNIQNLPNKKEVRAAFKGQGANVLLAIDYSSQESQILADKSEEPRLLEFYLNGEADLHSYAAKLIWPDIVGKDTPLSEVKSKFGDLRQKAKAANFAIAYGGNGYTIAQNLNISPEEGDRIYNAYMKAFPGLAAFFSKQKALALKRGWATTGPTVNRKRYFGDISDAHRDFKKKNAIERMALNTPIQGEAANMSKLAGIYMYQWIIKNKRWGKVKLVNFVHDEWVIECNQRVAERTAEAMSECMERASSKFLKHIPFIKAEAAIAKHWIH